MPNLPDTQIGRLELVGRALHGSDWHIQVATRLGMHRATLWRWMTDRSSKVPSCDAGLLDFELSNARCKRRKRKLR